MHKPSPQAKGNMFGNSTEIEGGIGKKRQKGAKFAHFTHRKNAAVFIKMTRRSLVKD